MESFTKREIAAFYAVRVPEMRRTRGKEWRAPCPVHKGERDSFSVNAATGAAFCHSTCGKGWDMIALQRECTGQDFTQARSEVYRLVGRPESSSSTRVQQSVIEYAYTDAHGKTVFVVERRQGASGKKDFKVRAPAADGSWVWKKPRIADTLPYRMHRLAGAETVYIPEGEKDVDTLERWGLVATTNAFGAKKWKPGHAAYLSGKHVVILPDNDADGRAHAEIVRKSLRGVAASIRLVTIPGLAEKGDVTDWKESGGTLEQLNALVKATPADHDASSLPDDIRNFRADQSGLFVEMVKDGKMRFVRVGPPLEVIARTRNFEGEACGKQVRFRNWDGQERSCIIQLATLIGDNRDSLDRLLNLGYQPNRDRRAIEAVKDFIYQTNPERFVRCVPTIGWHSGSFVFPDRTISPASVTEEILFQSEITGDHKFRSKGTLEAWQQSVSRLCAGNSRLVFAVSCAFAAALLDPLKTEGGGIHIRGLSSTGKTTAVLAAGSVWGGSPQLGFLETWRATANGIEARAALHNHSLLCLDEIGEVSEKEVGEIVYALVNGSGRGRMTRALTSRTSSQFKLIFLSTGERTLQEVMQSAGKQTRGGQETRLLEIPADAGCGLGIFESIHQFPSSAAMAQELARAARSNYGTAIDHFIRHLVEHRESVVESVRKVRDDFLKRRVSREDSGEVYRAASLFGLIAAAGELATEIGLTGWNRKESLMAADACFVAWIENRGGTGARDVFYGIEAVRAFIQVHGVSRFQDIGSGNQTMIHNRAGYKEKSGEAWRYFIFRHTFKDEICRGYDHQAVARELIRRGLMEAQDEGSGRLTLRKRLAGANDRFFAVLPSLISDDSESEE
jgi:uncharacterized protein (DUF927 family)